MVFAGSGMASMVPLRNSTLVAPAFVGVGEGQGEHLVGHVQPVGLAGGADAAGGEQDVDAAAGAEVEHAFAFVEVGDGERVAAAEGGGDGVGGQGVALVGGVEGGAEVLVDLDRLRARNRRCRRSVTCTAAAAYRWRTVSRRSVDCSLMTHSWMTGLVGARSGLY